MPEIAIFCKCEYCGVIFSVEKRRRYCTKSHRHAAYYQRKKTRLLEESDV